MRANRQAARRGRREERDLRAVFRPVDLVYFASLPQQRGGRRPREQGWPPRLGLCGDSLFCELTLTAGRQEAAKTSAGQEEGPPGGGAAGERDVSRGRRPRLGLFGLSRFFAETLAAGRQEAAKTSAGQEEGPQVGEAAEKGDVSRHCLGRLGFWGLSRFPTQTLAGGCPAAAGVTVSAARAGQAAAARALRR